MLGLVGAIFGFLILVWLAFTALYIWTIVDVARIPDGNYQGAGTSKVVWILVVVLLGWIGTLIWVITKRKEVLAAGGGYGRGGPPAGGYGPPGYGQQGYAQPQGYSPPGAVGPPGGYLPGAPPAGDSAGGGFIPRGGPTEDGYS